MPFTGSVKVSSELGLPHGYRQVGGRREGNVTKCDCKQIHYVLLLLYKNVENTEVAQASEFCISLFYFSVTFRLFCIIGRRGGEGGWSGYFTT